MSVSKQFFYLNLENQWPLFELHGLEINQDGSLTLARVPQVETGVEITVTPPDFLIVPAGIAADRYGNIYLSDPEGNCIFKYDICTKRTEPIPCLAGDDNAVGIFKTPRGLLIGSNDMLYVADSGNHRILLFDLHTFQLKEVWGQAEPFMDPTRGDEPGHLNDPWEMARDSAGNIYVVDHGNGRVQKFDGRGNVIPDFWETMSAEAPLREPSFITIAIVHEEELLFVIDRRPINEKDQVFVFNTEGHWKSDLHFSVQVPHETTKVDSAGVVVTGDAVYIGDNVRNGVFKFHVDGNFLGRARDYTGPVAALGLDNEGNILAHSGDPEKMVRLVLDKAFVPRGSFVAGPFNPEDKPVQWHRLQVNAEALPKGAHAQFFAATTDHEIETNEFIEQYYNSSAEDPFDIPVWNRIPRDIFDAIIPSRPFEIAGPPPTPTPSPTPTPAPLTTVDHTGQNENSKFPRDKAKYLWLGGLCLGDETVSPIVHQIRVDYNQDTYLRFLPPIYAKDAKSRDFLERFLSLFESILGCVEDHIHCLPALFDPYAAPARFLPWLASWLALDLDEEWDEQKKRDAIARAFELQSLRGTVEGMQQYLKLYANVDARIEEPLLWTSLWSLPVKAADVKEKEIRPECWFVCPPTSPHNGKASEIENSNTSGASWFQTEGSILGYTTMLAPAHAQGAVVGTTATLDQSHLIEDRDFGAPLFEDLAYFFYVLVYRNQLRCQRDLDKVRTVIEREKPAHTDYHLCVIEPKMRVGFQSRVGIDTIVADEPSDMVLTAPTKLGHDTVISEFSGIRRKEGLIERDTRVGIKTSMT